MQNDVIELSDDETKELEKLQGTYVLWLIAPGFCLTLIGCFLILVSYISKSETIGLIAVSSFVMGAAFVIYGTQSAREEGEL